MRYIPKSSWPLILCRMFEEVKAYSSILRRVTERSTSSRFVMESHFPNSQTCRFISVVRSERIILTALIIILSRKDSVFSNNGSSSLSSSHIRSKTCFAFLCLSSPVVSPDVSSIQDLIIWQKGITMRLSHYPLQNSSTLLSKN
jgi:hypothetical protein